jgi:hypothetical protein
VWIEEVTVVSWRSVRDPPFARAWWENRASVAKPATGVTPVVRLLDRLMIDRALRRLSGFPPHRTRIFEASSSRIFHEFTEVGLGQRVAEDRIRKIRGDQIHLSVWRGNLLRSLRIHSLHRIMLSRRRAKVQFCKGRFK